MNKKMMTLLIISIIAVILLAPYSTAIKIPKEKENNLIETERNIEKNSFLTKSKIPLLKLAQIQTNDNQLKEKLSTIIEKIETDGYASSSLIKKVMGKNGGIYSGKIQLYATNNAGIRGFPGSLLRKGFCWLFLSWDAPNVCSIDAQYGRANYDDVPHKGIALLGFGHWEFFKYNGANFDVQINGISSLIIIY